MSVSSSLAVRVVCAYLVLSHNAMVRKLPECLVPIYSANVIQQFELKRLLRDADGKGLDALVEQLTVVCMSECPEIMMADQMWFVLREEPLRAHWKVEDGGTLGGALRRGD